MSDFCRARRWLALCSLWCCAQSAMALPNACTLGPWQLGMSRAQVSAFADYGPYTDVELTGGVETRRALIGGRRSNVSFVFDNRGVSYMLYFAYEGRDFRVAKQALLAQYDSFAREFGGASVPNFDVTSPSGRPAALDRASFDDLVQRALGEAKAMGEKTLRERGSSVSMMFDLIPKRQPCATRVQVQWGYHSKHDTYYVLVFHDRKDAAARKIERNFRLGPP